MQIVQGVGILAAIASTASFAPQAWRIVRTRDTSALSVYSCALTVTAFGLWLTYGLLMSDWAIAAPNATCLVLSSFILTMKILPKRAKDRIADGVTLNASRPPH